MKSMHIWQAAMAAVLLSFGGLDAAGAQPATGKPDFGGDVSTHALMPFRLKGQNPWGRGPEYVWKDEKFLGLEALNASIPTSSISPYRILADVLGVPLPELGFADAGADLRGKVGFRFEYHISGGRLDIDYPARLTTTVRGIDPKTHTAPGNAWVTVDTAFEPGFALAFEAVTPLCSEEDNVRCAMSKSFNIVETQRQPSFTTTFPQANARIAFEADLEVAARLRAGAVKLGRDCYLCKELRIATHPKQDVELLYLGVDRVSIIGPCRGSGTQAVVGQCDFQLAGRRIPLGSGYLTFDDPSINISRTSVHNNGRTLRGADERPIISFSASIEKLVPAIGPLLTNDAGVVNYNLFETTAGPTLGLKQAISVTVTPRVRMDFSREVEIEHQGRRTVGQTIDVEVGNRLRWRLRGAHAGPVIFRPHFYLTGRVVNETGISLGYHMDVRALAMGAGPAKLGPAVATRLSEPAGFGAVVLAKPEFDIFFRGFDGAEMRVDFNALAAGITDQSAVSKAMEGPKPRLSTQASALKPDQRPKWAEVPIGRALPPSKDLFRLDKNQVRLYVREEPEPEMPINPCVRRPETCPAFSPRLRTAIQPQPPAVTQVVDISTTDRDPRIGQTGSRPR